ncbi:GNAT family N-acetyltransferase [Paraburkholderia sp. CNPSo 3157]|uniref:GNAT family N-acetyltransferase n=1 Tax=Paraburkholderia franconis TaxID=2654983 RepID=A0A7X1TDQ0_9BURK|nr:arsenic resistance N-acetyltransferase ArsN2 [Paraburkholderia franconis]MPW15525.1 GNAT family N-acetyltransferase [Paraburkholderia franconis]
MDDLDMKIRSARPEDMKAIRELLAGCSLPVEDVSDTAPIQFLVAANDGDAIAGCVGIETYGPVGLLRSLAVVADARGARIGHALVTAVENAARQEGIEELYLLTNTASLFFQGNAYQLVSRESVPLAVKQTTQFSMLCPASAVCMTKRISMQ